MNDPYLKSLLGEREEVLLVTRQHWFLLFRNILFELLLIAASIVVVSLLLIFWAPQPSTGLGFLIVLIPLASLLRDVLLWSNHKYIVTNRRVIQVFGVLNKNITDSSLEKVNDVKMEQSAFGRLFDFGDIEILTASELGINRFTSIGDPVRFKKSMLDAKFKLEINEGPQFASQSMMDVPRLIQELDALRRDGALTDEEFNEKKRKLLERI